MARKFDGKLHDGARGTKYIDMPSLDHVFGYIHRQPERTRIYIMGYGSINPDTGSDTEAEGREFRTIARLARPDYYDRPQVRDAIRMESAVTFREVDYYRIVMRAQ